MIYDDVDVIDDEIDEKTVVRIDEMPQLMVADDDEVDIEHHFVHLENDVNE